MQQQQWFAHTYTADDMHIPGGVFSFLQMPHQGLQNSRGQAKQTDATLALMLGGEATSNTC